MRRGVYKTAAQRNGLVGARPAIESYEQLMEAVNSGYTIKISPVRIVDDDNHVVEGIARNKTNTISYSLMLTTSELFNLDEMLTERAN